MNKVKILCLSLLILVCLFATASAQPGKRMVHIDENTISLDYLEGVYPSVEARNAIAEAKINTEIEKVISNFEANIRRENLKEGSDQVKGYVDYKVKANRHGIFSVIISTSTMYKGAAHPSTYYTGLSFDKQGNRIYLKDILEDDKLSGDNYYTVENLKAAVLAQASDKIFNDPPLNITKFPQEFYLDSRHNLHVLFQPYDIAPYAAGLIDINLK